MDYPKFLKLFGQIHNKYKRNVAYHNDLHGSDVAQHCNLILKTQEMGKYCEFNNMDTLALLVAAFCHDVQHDGFNNRYHVLKKSPLFQMYGDEQVQENNHAAQTLKLLDNFDTDFISSKFTKGEGRIVKKRIIESILFTDMASMNKLRDGFQSHLNKFGIKNAVNREKLIDHSSVRTEEQSKQLMSSVILHACDISTSLRDFETSVFNVRRLTLQLYISLLCLEAIVLLLFTGSGERSFIYSCQSKQKLANLI